MPLIKKAKSDIKELIPRYLREYSGRFQGGIPFYNAMSTPIVATNGDTEIYFSLSTGVRRDKKGRFVGHKKNAEQYILENLKVHYPDMEVE
jgi:hypothetical protein